MNRSFVNAPMSKDRPVVKRVPALCALSFSTRPYLLCSLILSLNRAAAATLSDKNIRFSLFSSFVSSQLPKVRPLPDRAGHGPPLRPHGLLLDEVGGRRVSSSSTLSSFLLTGKRVADGQVQCPVSWSQQGSKAPNQNMANSLRYSIIPPLF